MPGVVRAVAVGAGGHEEDVLGKRGSQGVRPLGEKRGRGEEERAEKENGNQYR